MTTEEKEKRMQVPWHMLFREVSVTAVRRKDQAAGAEDRRPGDLNLPIRIPERYRPQQRIGTQHKHDQQVNQDYASA